MGHVGYGYLVRTRALYNRVLLRMYCEAGIAPGGEVSPSAILRSTMDHATRHTIITSGEDAVVLVY